MTLDKVVSRDRLPSLTGLRFWAALLVVLYHLSRRVGEIPGLSDLAWFGRSGVTFFFVLSGFVLTWTYLDQMPRLSTFWWRRFARIWPALAVSTTLTFVVAYAVTAGVDPWHVLSMLTGTMAWREEWVIGVNGAWSLSDEAFFYLLFPALLVLATARTGRRLLWAGVLVALPLLWLLFATGSWERWAFDYLPAVRLVQFVLGILCAIALKRGLRAPVSLPVAVALVVAYHVALLAWEGAIDPLSPAGAYSGSQWWATPFFALLVMAAAQADRDRTPSGLRGAASIRLGHWSYSWYLLHGIGIEIWVASGMDLGGGVGTPAAWLLLGGGSLLAAGALYTWVEDPAERALRAVGPGRERASRSATMSA
jgi:peptidoglycan/LPS O-acetylase OafA/YrhL